ncbi:Putative L,D-transpeptidase YkuD [Sedimentisphaera cyanobacteriorum]|uniref:L,D-transpeptidase YkuD n=1 Tax=Sedimentisphaera cyanobacteriorum TaxID=1940790 RepID=A0A1Q2HQ45_9BACT|nr:L,D-transpeptidase family protein [Sedimentisphaera cyanobacteriorum]AQQ09577.1 Putative L,D-transpeptidase YkuD [Sedimentisphaera cyanobacteriorum]
MARKGYVPYSSRQKKKNTFIFAVIGAIIAAGIFFAFKALNKAEETELPESSQTALSEEQAASAETASQTEQQSSSQEPAENEADTEQSGEAPRYLVGEAEEQTRAEREMPLTEGEEAGYADQDDTEQTPADTDEGEEQDSAYSDTIGEDDASDSEDSEGYTDESDVISGKISNARSLVRSGEVIKARDMLNNTLSRYPDSLQRRALKDMLEKLSERWLFSEDVLKGDPHCHYYTVQRGDMLSRIGDEYNVPWEFLLKINDMLRPEQLRAGEDIKVVKGPFNLIVNKSTYNMDLYLDNLYVKSYPIGIGREEHATPTGMWVVKPGGKMVSPTWTDPDSGRTYDAMDPDYPLGKRWIAIKGISGDAKGRTGFAIHGTSEPESIGQKSSRGCIRLSNEDVVEVYDLMMLGKSHVQIIN